MTRPPFLWNRRVVIAFGLLALGLVTDAWWKNPVSGTVIIITAIALAVWYGAELSKHDAPGDVPETKPGPKS